MLQFHFCTLFNQKVESLQLVHQESVKNKIRSYKNRNDLKNISNMEDLGGDIYLLKIHQPESRVIIEEREHNIGNEIIKVFFVRDIITNIKFDREAGRLWYGKLKRGDWLRENELNQKEIKEFESQYLQTKSAEIELRIDPPHELTNWLPNFQLQLNNEIFETEDWVAYALSNNLQHGMIDTDTKIFRLVIDEILHTSNTEYNVLRKNKDLTIFSYEKHFIGIIFSKITIEGTEYVILYNGAHIKTQSQYWEESIATIKEKELSSISTYEELSRLSFRSYPKWTIKNDELWFRIEKSEENSNLSLTNKQVDFLKKFQFPYYINGQAGSGKSTLLYYIFSNIIYYKALDSIDGEIIFLTENEQLLDDTKKNVFDLLENNPEFGLDHEEVNEYTNKFYSFKNFLLNMLNEDDLECFHEDKYLHFPIFKTFYEKSTIKASIKKEYSAEEAWFVIVTYIYGHDLNTKVISSNYEDTISSKSRKVQLDRFIDVEQYILPFYENLLNEGYWDKLKIIRYINQNINLDFKTKYDVIVCDEAQDFCKVELGFILKQSKYLQYDLSNISQVPILFAGDANQTVNPTGFRDAEMTSLLYQELKEVANYNYDKEDIFYSPNLNYRSVSHVVNLANLVQYYRMKHLDINHKYLPQESKRPNQNVDDHFNIFLDYKTVGENHVLNENIIKKLQYKIFIIPVDSGDKEIYKNSSNILSKLKDIEIKTSVESKGAEYKQVVLYGFGEYYLKKFLSLDNDDEKFQRSYYFNKLYVAITRAKIELVIIDSHDSQDKFWKKIVNELVIVNQNGWGKLKELQNKIITYNTGSVNNILNDILQSTKEDAFENAQEDKKLGEYHQNPSRLKVAASQFFRLGDKSQANECLGLAEEITHNYRNAAKYYKEANKLEFASNAFFKGRDFDNLEGIGTYVQNIDHDLRMIIAQIMQDELITNDEVEKLSKYKGKLSLLVKNLLWRDELINRLIDFAKKQEQEIIQELVKVFETVAKASDIKLYQEIGHIQYKLREYKEAINAWEKIDFYDNEKYYLAKIEFYQQKHDNENKVIYLNELIRFKEDKDYIDIYKSIIELHEKQANIESFSNEYYLIVYRAWIIIESMQNIIKFGRVVEEHINHFEVEFFYKTMIEKYTLSKEIFNYIMRRWVKVVANNIHDFDQGYLDRVNQAYLMKSKVYHVPYKPFKLEEVEKISDLPQEITFVPSEHLSQITIQNFRQFEHLTLTDIGQFNLIVGDNNVGKTSLLEALLFSNDTESYYNNLAFAYIARNNASLVQQDMDELKYKLPKQFLYDFFRYNDTNNEIIFNLQEDRNQWSYKIKVPTSEDLKDHFERDSVIDLDDYICMVSDKKVCDIGVIPLIIKKLDPYDIIKMQLIPFGKGFDRTLAKNYHDNIGNDKKKRRDFLESMRIFIPDIEQIITDTKTGDITIEELGRDESVLLHQYGEGANKLFRILIQITLQKGKKLLIDEIDAGIHHSHFKEFWKIILKVADENKVQIFVTTHNLECIQYFKEVLEKKESYQEKSKVIALRKFSDNTIESFTRRFQEFEYELNNEFEIRGGVL